MRVEYDRELCAGWFQCVQEWDAFEINIESKKADLRGGESTSDGTFVREVEGDVESQVRAAAESCPVDAIVLYDDDGVQLYP